MELDRKTITILVVVAVILVVLWWGSSEHFTASQVLDTYYQGSSDIESKLIDQLTCSKSCCGDQYPAPFDGLTSNEIYATLSESHMKSPNIRTNYTCADGPGGVGCPCVKQDAYLNLVNHGSNGSSMDVVEPTFFIDAYDPMQDNFMSPYEVLQAAKSMRAPTVKLNDLVQQRAPISLANVQPNPQMN